MISPATARIVIPITVIYYSRQTTHNTCIGYFPPRAAVNRLSRHLYAWSLHNTILRQCKKHDIDSILTNVLPFQYLIGSKFKHEFPYGLSRRLFRVQII